MIRVYGRQGNWGSHAQVTEGFRIGLEAHGVLAGMVGTDLVDVGDVGDQDVSPGNTAHFGLLTAGIQGSDVMNPAHKRRIFMLAPNSTRIPESYSKQIPHLFTDVLVPSEWAAKVVAAEIERVNPEGFKQLRNIQVVRHGVHPAMVVHPPIRQMMHEVYDQGGFRVVHFSTSDRERKGTKELLQAWVHVHKEIGGKLVLVLDPQVIQRVASEFPADIFRHDVVVAPRLVDFYAKDGRVGMSPHMVAHFLSHFHVVCQPSRGEAFGMIPLEARCCGVPAVYTMCTGHTEHLQIGDNGSSCVIVPHTMPLQDIDDLPGAKAPGLDVEQIAEALREAHANWKTLASNCEQHADELRAQWTWERQLAPFVAWAKKAMKED